MKRIALVAGTFLGVAAVVAGVFVGWNRIQPQFRVPTQNLVVTTLGAKELQKQQIAKETAELQTILDRFSAKYPGQFGIVVTDLKNGATAAAQATQQMVAASLYKLYVAYGIYKKIDAGQLKTTSKTTGSDLSVGKCLEIMIVVSDNDCGYALGVTVGWAALDADLARLGLTQTRVNNYVTPTSGNVTSDKLTSAADIALFIDMLYRGKLLSASSTKAFMDIMKATQLNTWLPSGLPDDAVIAHKTGALYNLVHDGGVVYTKYGDYLIVVMSRDWRNAQTQPPPAFADISRQLWDYFNLK